MVLLVISFLGPNPLCFYRDRQAPDNVYVWAMTGYLAGGIRERAGDALTAADHCFGLADPCNNAVEIRGCAEENADLPCFLPASNREVRPSQPCRPAFALRRFAVWQGEGGGSTVKERGCGWSRGERPFQLLLPIRSRLIIEDKGDTQLLHSQDGVPVRDHVDLRAEG